MIRLAVAAATGIAGPSIFGLLDWSALFGFTVSGILLVAASLLYETLKEFRSSQAKKLSRGERVMFAVCFWPF